MHSNFLLIVSWKSNTAASVHTAPAVDSFFFSEDDYFPVFSLSFLNSSKCTAKLIHQG
jgi:hypothetical protein